MKVMYTCDNNYVWLMGISTISLFENNKNLEELIVYLLGENISEQNIIELEKIGHKYGRKVIIIDVPQLNIPSSLVSVRWPLSAFTRLISGKILPSDVEKILYLDCDTVVLGDISELEDVDFNGNIVMGVKDCISGTYKKNIGLNKNSPYVNAGVILFDMTALRRIDIALEIEKYMSKYMKLINYADQDILNGIFLDRIGEINPKFDVMTIDVVHTHEEIRQLRRPTNFYTKNEIDEAKINPTIIHYTTNMKVVRPWFSNTNHPFSNEFKRYMDMSVWKNKKLHKMVFDSKEAKVIGLISKFPKCIAYNVLGLIHADLRPRYIRIKAVLL